MDATAPPAPPEPPALPPPPPPHRALRRDRKHRVLGGVCAGIARTYGIDMWLVRVIFVVAGFFWIGIPVYVIAWIAIPPDDGTAIAAEQPRDVGLLAALALIGLGTLIAASTWFPLWHGGRLVGPFVLIGGGLAILWMRRPAAELDTTQQPAPTTEGVARTDTETHDEPTAPSPPPQSAAEPASAWTQAAPWPTAREVRRAARDERRAQRPRSFLGPLTFSILLIGAGVAGLLQALEVVDINLTVVLAIGTCVVGAALVCSAWFGRAHGLIALGIVLLAATTLSSAIDVPIRGGIGHEQHHPFTLAGVKSPYELGIGHLELDLRDVRFPPGTTNVDASVGIGRLQVEVPSSVDVVIDGHAGAGSVKVFGRENGGFDRDTHREVRADALGDSTAVLHLKLRVGAGEVDVHRYDARGFETLGGGQP